MNKPHFEILLPIFNEENNIPPLMLRLDKAIEPLKTKAKFSFLFINDGSTDGSRKLLEELFECRTDIRVIHLLHNFGHSAAITCAIENCEADAVILMDADLQDPPEVIGQLIKAWEKGAKTVVAKRESRQEKTKSFFNLFYFLLHKSAKNLPPIDFGTHSLIDFSVVERLRKLGEKNRYFPGLVSYSSGKITSVSVHREARHEGQSRVGFWGLINLAITAFLSFSNVPIRLVSVFGLMASASSLIAALIFVSIKIFTNAAIPGWASTMSVMSFGMGLQLLCLGLIGEYIARIYEEVKQRPLYYIDTLLDKKKTKSSKAA